jgi:acetolactate synthase-1/2/3 large subunit
MPSEVLKAPMSGTTVYGPEHYAPAVSPGGDPDALREAARHLVEADRPLVITGSMGRHPEAVGSLVKLADKLALPVYNGRSMNFPTLHPLRVSDSSSFVHDADAILLIDADSPGGAPEDCKVISLDIDPVRLTNALWHGRINTPIQCDSSKAIPVLTELTDEFIRKAQRQKFRERRKEMEANYEAAKRAKAAAIEKAGKQVPISHTWLCHCINRVADENTILVNDVVREGIDQPDRARPGSFFPSPGVSLGWAVPAAMGAKLAEPSKTVIAATGDGGFNFCVPNACLWAARRYSIPFLTIIANNEYYFAVRAALHHVYPNGYAAQSGDFNGAALDPMIDYTLLAQSCGAYGETVTEPVTLPGALQRGLDAVHGGQAAVIDVRVALGQPSHRKS